MRTTDEELLEQAVDEKQEFQWLKEKINQHKEKMGFDELEIEISEVGLVKIATTLIVNDIKAHHQKIKKNFPETTNKIEKAKKAVEKIEKLYGEEDLIEVRVSSQGVVSQLKDEYELTITHRTDEEIVKYRLGQVIELVKNQQIEKLATDFKIKSVFSKLTSNELEELQDWTYGIYNQLSRQLEKVGLFVQEKNLDFEEEIENEIRERKMMELVEPLLKERYYVSDDDLPF